MPNRFHILAVDDEPVQRELISGFLRKQGFEVIVAESGERALELFRQDAFDLILTDQRMANMSGLDLLQAVHTINPETPVILVTAYGTIEAAVAALKQGAVDYLTKPVNLEELLQRIRQVSDRYRIINENRELREALRERHRIEGIIGESGQMLEVLSLVRRVAPSEATVLIRGESGTGKAFGFHIQGSGQLAVSLQNRAGTGGDPKGMELRGMKVACGKAQRGGFSRADLTGQKTDGAQAKTIVKALGKVRERGGGKDFLGV